MRRSLGILGATRALAAPASPAAASPAQPPADTVSDTARACGAGLPVAHDGALARAVDSVLAAGMRRARLPGAAVAVVRDGRVVLARGYGVRDLRTGAPPLPDATPFGLSSISKVLTAISVLQLAERGAVMLDADVNAHLGDARLPDAFGRSVTLAQLLTHTGGFDEASIGVAARRAEAVIPLGAYLAREMPPRVRAPGDVASYSNHGFALAGLAVERASGEPFAAYVRRHVLEPLGMRHSGFEQPLPGALEQARATPYEIAGDGWRAVPRIYFNDAPASALHATACDMARLAAALLAPDGGGVLSAASRARLFDRAHAHHPALRGLTLGMRERLDGAVRGVEQGGDWQDYSSAFVLAPDARLGAFVAFNAAEGDAVGQAVWRAVLERFEPAALAALAAPGASPGSGAPAGEAPDAARWVGTYRLNRHSRHSPARLGVLTGDIREVVVQRDGDALRALGTRLVPAGPALFRRDDTKTLVAFRADASGRGRATHAFFENSPYVAYERVPWHARRELHLAALGACLALLLASLAAPLVRRAAAAARLGGPDARSRAPMSRALRWLALAVDVLGLALVTWTVVASARAGTWAFQYGLPDGVRAALRLGPPLAVAAGALAAAVAVAWARGRGTPGARAWHTVHAVAALALVALLHHWRLIG